MSQGSLAEEFVASCRARGINAVLRYGPQAPRPQPVATAPAPAPVVTPERMAAYVAALRSQDWLYAYSDDFEVWSKGNALQQWLMREARDIDPDFKIMASVRPVMLQEQA